MLAVALRSLVMAAQKPMCLVGAVVGVRTFVKSESVAMGLREGRRGVQMATSMGEEGASEGEWAVGSLLEAVGICRC